MSEKINEYENTNRLFDKAADELRLDDEMRSLFKTPFREIQVEVPKKVNGRRAELLRELAEIEQADVMPEQRSFFDQVKEFFAGSEDES